MMLVIVGLLYILIGVVFALLLSAKLYWALAIPIFFVIWSIPPLVKWIEWSLNERTRSLGHPA